MAKELAEEKVKLPPAKSLTMNDIKLRECACNHWVVFSPPGTTRERLEEPSFWAVVASNLRAYDEITVIASERTAHSRWLVLQAGNGYAEVLNLSWTPLPALLASVGETLPSNHKLVFDAENGWSAVRISDGVVVVRDCKSQQEAVSRLLCHASLRQ